MHLLPVIVGVVAVAYIGLQLFHIYHWRKIPECTPAPDFIPKTAISVVVPARNEEENIVGCIYGLLEQNYPKHLLEIIVVDDQSDDATYELCEQIRTPILKLMRLGVSRKTTIQGSKKKALAYGITHAHGELIVTTDADCVHCSDWLLHLAYLYETEGSALISGPVNVMSADGMLNQMQLLDFTASGLINAAGIQARSNYLASGANLCFQRRLFDQIHAFEDNHHIASGDDVFIIHNFKKRFREKIHFLKSAAAIVYTRAERSWRAFFSQRLRWATKNKMTGNWASFVIAAFVWLQRASLVLIFGYAVVFHHEAHFYWGLAITAVVMMIDFSLQYEATGFFLCRKSLRWFGPAWILHTFYFLCVGLISWLPVEQQWKGRKIYY